ncbi:NADH-quinone oxidoreductase subunit D [Phocaeicola paurosaccharolyticus]|jgi:NADH-quinone oxidoreductase subunit C/D|uniref:NADH-quinone oxidoreductase subunit D n=1 Tax=Phocaeicola paurosaccharolyticus TaxID=732242 RepID=UPI00046A79D3|nr:NADH-quinone oxidoreductase subunit D [Phocaeicola paurosaccharolyticus]
MDKINEIEAAALHDEMLRLKEEKHMDFLRSLTGVDWQENGLGVVYHLENSETQETITIKCVAPNREKPEIPTVSDIWKGADFNEREVYDFLGIVFIGHPDMRRLYLRDDWVGYPLKKDYDDSLNPLRMTNEETVDSTKYMEEQPDGSVIEKRQAIFDEDEYIINIGPQHPATHGVLRFRVALEGEIIKKLDVHCGYIHRGIEKMCESLTYQQTLALTDRLDYLGAHQNRHALCMCVEKAMGVEVSERVQYIRTIMDELQRIDSHLLFFSCLCMDLGALTAFLYGFRDREKILDIFEYTTGGRLIQNYNTIGGVQADIAPDFVEKVKSFLTYLRPMLKEYNDVFTGNIIAQQRMKGVGLLSKEDAISFGATGGTGRASGWACDVRKRHPYAMYDKVDFKQIVRTEGDSYARYLVRIDEIVESMRIIEQLIDNIPAGEYQQKMKPIIKVPEGIYYSAVEGSRGEFGVFLESHGEKYPYRLKFRSTGLPLVSAMETMSRGAKIADLIAIGGTVDYVVPDIDR